MESDVKVVPDSISAALAKTEQVFTGATLVGHPAMDIDESESDEPIEAPPAPTPKEPTAPSTPAPTDPRPFKYATHEDAEEGYREAKRLMDEKATEANRLRDELDRRTAELDEAKRAPKAPEPPPASDGAFERALEEITALDPNAESYMRELSGKWKGAITQQAQALIGAEVTKLRQELRAEQETARTQARAETEQQRVSRLATEQAKDAGLDLAGSKRDSRLFWSVIAAEVDEEFPDLSYEEKITEAVKRIPTFRAPVTPAPAPPTPETVQARQAAQRPMGRGSSGPGMSTPVGPSAEAPVQPLTVEEAVQRTHRAQRI